MSDIRIATAEDQILLEKEAKYCSYGDTVHYIEPPRIFSRCEGSYVWDTEDQAYLDLQMWYSAVNFGYANPRLNNALKQQIDTLPQIASQYLHKGKIEEQGNPREVLVNPRSERLQQFLAGSLK